MVFVYVRNLCAVCPSCGSQDWILDSQRLKIPVDPAFSFTRILADPVVVREWIIMGLPADDFSVQV